MNKTHRLIWSDARQAWTVAHEAASSRGKPASRAKRLTALLSLLALQPGVFAQAPPVPTPPATLPTGAQVVAGQAAVGQAGSAMTIRQATDQLILNWGSFSIGSQASVTFQQPGAHAVALNRVVGADPSAIHGSLSANGQVFLVNPHGVLFGAGARVDVGGLVASTLALRNDDFLAGRHRFTREGAAGAVVNAGTLQGRYIAMLAPEVRNEGVVVARQGTVVMAAGESATLNLTGHQLIDVQVDPARIDTLVENKHLVQAGDGQVILSAQSARGLVSRVVNTGAIEATGLSSDGGTVRLLAGSEVVHGGRIAVDAAANGRGGTALLIADLANPASRTTVSGSITARGGGATGDGGFVETSASHLKVERGTAVDTRASPGKTGSWLLDPVDFTIAATGGDIDGATLEAALASSDVTISTLLPLCTGVTGCGAGSSGNGDIFVNDTLAWGANALTLSAERHIVINAPLNVTGTGGLNLKFDQADGFVGNYFVNAPVNLAVTSSFTTQAGTFFPAETYTVLVDQAGLMGMAVNDPAARYVLGRNVTASAPWTPIASGGTDRFMGVFDGLGHVVKDLTVAGTADHQGMFARTGVTASLQNIGLVNASVSGTRFVGALVGRNEGGVFRAHAAGAVTASAAGATPITAVGGLVGQNDGAIEGSRSRVNVTATSDTGGNVYAGGGLDGGIGGLVGISTSSISNSFATGSVAGLRDVGGLVGWADFNVMASYATGAVSLAGNGTDRVHAGGLIGHGGAMLGAGTAFWNTQTTGQPLSFNGTGFGAEGGMDTAQMQTPANFTSATAANGNVNPGWDPASWTLVSGSYPGLSFSNAGLSTAVTLTIAAASKVYGDANGSLPSLTLSGCTDCISLAGWGSALTSTTNAGDYAYSLANLLVLGYAGGTSASDYTITWADPSVHKFSVVPRTVTLNASKTYDGSAALTGAQLSIGNLVSGQTLNFSGATASDAHVATANKHVSGITLSDGTGLASNYRLPALTAASAGVNTVTINARSLSVTPSNTAVSKVYDGTTAPPVDFAPTYTLGGLLAGDTGATVTHSGAAYDSKNVATASKIGLSGLAIGGITGSNGSLPSDYVLDATAKDLAATITKKDITVAYTATSPVSKVYDGTTAADVGIGAVQINGVVAGEGLLIPAGTVNLADNTMPGTYSDKNANAALTVTVPLSGWQAFPSSSADPANYNLPASLAVPGEITKRPITGRLVGTVSKTYDGTAGASIALNNLQFDTSGYVAGELAYIDGASWQTGTYVDEAGQAHPRAGTGRKVVVQVDPSAYTAWNCAAVPFAGCTATNVNNYSFPTTLTGHVGTITPAVLTATPGNAGVSKVYDGTTAPPADFVPAYTVTGLVPGDTAAALTHASAAYDSKNVATASKITLGGVAIGGITGSQGSLPTDYVLNLTSSQVAANITPRDITLSFTPATVSKVYDGNDAATVDIASLPGFNFEGFVEREYLLPGNLDLGTGTMPGRFSGKDAGTGLTVTVPLSGWRVPEIVATAGYTGDPTNYRLPTSFTTPGEITKRPITGRLVGTVGKTYDGTANASIALNNVQFDIAGYVPGELAYINGSSWQSGSFVNAAGQADANAGTGRQVVVNINPAEYAPWPGTSTNLNNYSFPSVLSGDVGQITPKALTVSGVAAPATKTYDGTTAATVIGTPVLAEPIAAGTGLATDGKPYAGDTVNFTGSLAALYNSKDVATARSVTFSGLRSDNPNYTLTMPPAMPAIITARPLTVTPDNKTIFQNEPLPTFTYTVTGGLGEALGGSPETNAFSTATPGSYAITQGTLRYTSNANYTLDWTGNGTLTILPKPEDAFVPPTNVAGIGAITGGRGTVSVGSSGSTTTLSQQGNHLLLDWSGFAIPGGRTLEFAQPSASSVAVNRIHSGSPSEIFGTLKANGIVFLVNPSGIVFKPGAQIDVQGLVASAIGVRGFEPTVTPADIVWADLDTAVFNAPRLGFHGTGATLRNEANLSLGAGKFWGLHGQAVENAGSINVAGSSGVHVDTWRDADTLTLSAQDGIALAGGLIVRGNGRLILETGQGTAQGGSSDYTVQVAPTLGAGTSFATRQGREGALTKYTVVTDLAGLRAMSGNVAIGSNIDGGATRSGTPFKAANITGTVAGLGHTISNLQGNGFIETLTGTVRELGMVNVNFSEPRSAQPTSQFSYVSASLGGLANHAEPGSRIRNSYATGSVSGDKSVGGLVGITWIYIFGGGKLDPVEITNSHADVNVSGHHAVGGLVGLAGNARISNSYATGTVVGEWDVGGLVGEDFGSFYTRTFATGNVTGSSEVGGLLGNSESSYLDKPVIFRDSYASGNVTGARNAGALLGSAVSAGFDARSFANTYGLGKVNGRANGELIGSSADPNAVGLGQRLTPRESVSAVSYAGWDFTNTWQIEAGKSTPWLQGLPRPANVSVNVPPVAWDAGKLFVSLFNTSQDTSLGMVSRYLGTVGDETKYVQQVDLKEIRPASNGQAGVGAAQQQIAKSIEQMAQGGTLSAEQLAQVNKDFTAVLKAACPSCATWTDAQLGFWMYVTSQTVNQPERLQAAAEAKAKAAAEKAAAEKAAAEKLAAERAAAAKLAAEKAAAEKAAADKAAAAKKIQDDKRSAANALENAKREAAFWAKETQRNVADAAAARATANEAQAKAAHFEAEQRRWAQMSADKASQAPLLAQAAAKDLATANAAYAKWSASDATLKRLAPAVDAADNAKQAAERELAKAQAEVDALEFNLVGSDLFSVGLTVASTISKDQKRPEAEARLARAQEAFDAANKAADEKRAAYNALVVQANAEADASNAAGKKAAQSDLQARQARADKEVADKNIVIQAENAKKTADYAKQTDEYARGMETKAQRAAAEQQVMDERVKKAEEALRVADSKN